MTPAELAYCSGPGAAYWERNLERLNATAHARAAALRSLMPSHASEIWLEVGGGRGHNLRSGDVCLDVDARQLQHVQSDLIPVLGSAYNLPFPDNAFYVVCSVGCLMHLPDHGGDWSAYQTSYHNALTEMIRVSKRYLILGEYVAPVETPIIGHHWDGMLWARPYTTPSTLRRIATYQPLPPFDDDVAFMVYEKC